MSDVAQLLRADRRSRQGSVAGIAGCIFAVLGIFTIGVVFIPIAGLFSTIGILRGVAGPSVAGIAWSCLSGLLTVIGFAMSPVLMAAAGLVVFSNANFGAPQKTEEPPRLEPSIHFVMPPNVESLPRNGKDSWCGSVAVLNEIILALSDTDAVKAADIRVTAFNQPRTIGTNYETKNFSCSGVAVLTNGQELPGVFSVGSGRWSWTNTDQPVK